MSKTVISVVYVDDCLFWARSQSDIDNIMKSFNKYGPSYNWEHSNGYSVFEFLCIDMKKFDNGGFQFYQTGVIHKFLEATVMEHCNGFTTHNKVQVGSGTYWGR